jgi:hypothetical protein
MSGDLNSAPNLDGYEARVATMLRQVEEANELDEAVSLGLTREEAPEDWERRATLFQDLAAEGLLRADSIQPFAGGVSVWNARLTQRGREWLRDYDAQEETALATVLTPGEVTALEPSVKQLVVLVQLPEFDDLDADVQRDIDAQVRTVDAQVRAAHPQRSIVAAALGELHVVALGIAGSVIGNALTPVVAQALRHIGLG